MNTDRFQTADFESMEYARPPRRDDGRDTREEAEEKRARAVADMIKTWRAMILAQPPKDDV